MWLRIYQHLLPKAKAWRITTTKNLRLFFQGLGGLPSDVKDYADAVWSDIDPQQTRALAEWEQQWYLPAAGLTTQQRRDRLQGVWPALGGQSPRYLEDTLQGAGFNVFIHEWWVPGSNPVTARIPFDYLNDGAGFYDLTVDGAADAQDGDALAMDGSTSEPVGYPLVNKIFVAGVLCDGNESMQDGDELAMDGGVLSEYSLKRYSIPADVNMYPYFLYIGAEMFPEIASVPLSRKDEFEELALKICPTHQWLGILVNYN